jgi:NAD+ kinase
MCAASVGIIYKPSNQAAKRESVRLGDWLQKRGLQVFSEETAAKESFYSCDEPTSSIPYTVDWAVVLGGDGTLLGAARRVGQHGVPMLGVNLGGLGFLTGVPLEDLYRVMEMMIAGELEVENRLMLEARVIRQEKEVCSYKVLNDVVINKGILARIIDLEVAIDGKFLTVFRADGLIIATPTGSTAYNLSAGGPILYPTMETFVLTPICPFTLTNRPVLLPETSDILVTMGKESEETVTLTFDGQVGFELHYGDQLVISGSDTYIKLLQPPDHSFFRILRTKLKWGGATHEEDAEC